MAVSTAQRVNDFIRRHRPAAVCDACICKGLNFNYVSQAALITMALGTTSDFLRQDGYCVICGNGRIVTQATAKPSQKS